jgi:hypothetical protein
VREEERSICCQKYRKQKMGSEHHSKKFIRILALPVLHY